MLKSMSNEATGPTGGDTNATTYPAGPAYIMRRRRLAHDDIRHDSDAEHTIMEK